jgi:hypothetical protein
MKKMSCSDLLEEGKIFEARDLMTRDTRNSGEHDKVYEIIKSEYADLKHCQSRIAKETSWKLQKRKKSSFDTDDKVEIFQSKNEMFLKDYLLKVEIVDVVDLPFEILKYINMCDMWIGCVTESSIVLNISKNIYILKLHVIHHFLTTVGILSPRDMFVKVTIFNNSLMDNTSGVMIKQLSGKDCENIMPPDIYSKHRRTINKVKQQTKNNTIGNFETVTFFFHNVENRKKDVENNTTTIERIEALKCSIFIQNLTFSKFAPDFIGLPIISDFIYSSCIWWTLHSKKLLVTTGPISKIRDVIYEKLRKDEQDKKHILKELLEKEENKIREDCARKNVSVCLIDI